MSFECESALKCDRIRRGIGRRIVCPVVMTIRDGLG